MRGFRKNWGDRVCLFIMIAFGYMLIIQIFFKEEITDVMFIIMMSLAVLMGLIGSVDYGKKDVD